MGNPWATQGAVSATFFATPPKKSAMENGKGANAVLTMVKIYRVTGDEAEMCSLDARRAVKEHPNEWSYQPWTKDQQQDALEKALQADIDKLDA